LEVSVLRISPTGTAFRALLVASLVVIPALAGGQTPAPTQQSAPAMTKEEVIAFAKLQIAINKVQDSAQAQLAAPRNKTKQRQDELREKLRTDVGQVLHHAGVSEADFRRKTYLVSTNGALRKTFDSTITVVTGAPLPGTQVAAAAAPMVANLPAGPVGTHIGHVVNMFGDTPGGVGLLPMAITEARTASQHAGLGARDPNNLDAMKLHAGHVVHALDPSVVSSGPGRGYGAKRAALGVASHIDLAAKAQGASQNVITHANHIGTAAKSAAARADQVVAIARQIQMATTAADAAKLYSQMVPLAQQLYDGFDANSDGRVGWQEGEGGLAQAEQHIMLMLNGEK
jgi:hypothetical protein